ncbi:hypothetical protein I5Q34_13725 [Streptomyces sp. AV19]|uniref:hypothetical protein n=1 Tax=Streptomyces sp. AV19 TaxID=2793068 RepID=UPI0018FE6E69|nr:hypothetical protein [Streptomyces sp. AV19]MBH1935319.1 hypothetical protein [Streptomyces sp. AV19]MDG4531204.1 hypothetical protein [Streptomyces sp. AV19]
MAESYPIVEQREFGRPQERGNWLRKHLTRDEGDVPRLAAHHVLVYRRGEEYVEEHGLLGPADDVVVTASSVTVVDRRAGVPVRVEMPVPSAEQGDFTLRVTFHCTVTDAPAVVRDGVTDVEALLLGYLRGIPGLSEQALEFPVMAVDRARLRIGAYLEAYREMTPPLVSGLKAVPVAVEVLTPEQFAAHLREVEEARLEREKQRLRREVEKERAEAEHAMQQYIQSLEREKDEAAAHYARERAEAEEDRRREREQAAAARRLKEAEAEEIRRRERELIEERHRQQFEDLRATYEQTAGAVRQDHELGLRRKHNEYIREETAQDVESFGHDPVAADVHAFQRGEITADELAARLRADEEARLGREDRRDERDWARLERKDAVAREELRHRLDVEREDTRYRLDREDRVRELTRKDAREDAAAGRQEALRRRQQEREDAAARRQEEREADAALRQEDARRWEVEREDARRMRDEVRADALEHRKEQRELRERVLQARSDLTKRVIDRGHADDAVVDVGALINGVGEIRQATAYALPGGEVHHVERADGAPAPDDTSDDDLGDAGREEHVG